MACATYLKERGCQVSLFDKGRGPGGRMSTRRIAHDGREFRFDHGAQYFSVKDEEFARQMKAWAGAGIVARWPQDKPDAWVGTPGMNAPLQHMAQDLDIAFGSRIVGMQKQGNSYLLQSGSGTLPQHFDSIAVAVPAEQATTLLGTMDFGMARHAVAVSSAPCWTLMCAFAEKLDGAPESYRSDGAIAWAAQNSAKPDRDAEECWVVQAGTGWSRKNLELEPQAVVPLLLEEFAQALRMELPEPLLATAHRWRFAFPTADNAGCLWDPEKRLGACGDWLAGATVEDAWLSGRQLARTMLREG